MTADLRGVHLYWLSWTWWEEHEPIVLAHRECISGERWEKLKREALRKAVEELLAGEDGYIGMNDIVEKTAEILCRDYGFYKPEFTASLVLWGGVIIDRYGKHEVETLTKLVGKDLTDKLVEHNEKIHRRLGEEVGE